jgi:hypothetical protein
MIHIIYARYNVLRKVRTRDYVRNNSFSAMLRKTGRKEDIGRSYLNNSATSASSSVSFMTRMGRYTYEHMFLTK